MLAAPRLGVHHARSLDVERRVIGSKSDAAGLGDFPPGATIGEPGVAAGLALPAADRDVDKDRLQLDCSAPPAELLGCD